MCPANPSTNNIDSSWTADKAKGLGLTGYVQNESDGTVAGEAQGDQSSLDKFVQHLNKGPSAAVSQVFYASKPSAFVRIALSAPQSFQPRKLN